ncbi:MAG: exo-alpha-sialidase, partial [Thaumarchaeota archaeon]|nr:exo-alpha-sialidase [Nitrososphaerota archaeon]
MPKPVQLIQTIASDKDLYILWSGYDANSQHNAVLLSTSEDGGSSFKVKDLTEFGIGSVDKMRVSNASLYLISKNTITESRDNGNSFGQPVVLNGEGNSAVSDLIASGTNVYATIDDVIKDGDAFQILFSASNDSGTTFHTPIKLFGMPETSQDYSQMAAIKNNVYVIAEGKYATPAGPVGVLFKKSNDNGTTFGNTVDLANDSSVDFAPKIAASGPNVYVVWSELGSKGAQLYFRSSQDYGQTFGPATKLGIEPDLGTTDCDFPRVLPGDNNTVYVSWWSVHFENQTETDTLLFRKSDDSGKTFGDTIKLSGNKTSPEDLGHNTAVVASGKNVYAMWMSYYDVQSVDNVQVLFTKSNDGGNTFSDPINLNINSFGGSQMGAQNPQISPSGNDAYAAWDTGNSNQEI